MTLGGRASPDVAISSCPEILLVIHAEMGWAECIMKAPGGGPIVWEGLESRRCCIMKTGALGFRLLAFCCSSAIGENFMLLNREILRLGGMLLLFESLLLKFMAGGAMPWL